MGTNEMARSLLTQEPGRGNRHAEAAGNPNIATSQPTIQKPAGDHRESADDYRGELFRSGNLRVAVCADGLQWLYQRRDPVKAMAGARWRTLGFCRTRAALERLQRENLQPPAPEIAALPERFKRKGGKE